jgi:hypothetical protein
MILEQSISRSSGRWRKSRCSDLWCRRRAGGQSASSPSALIPSTIPKSISDGVSRCFSMPASGASGLRTGAAARRLHRNIGCSLITSKSCAMAVHRSIQQTANAFAVPTIPVKPCKPGRTGELLPAGGRGFNSLRRGCPATAPTLMRRFFFGPKLLIFFKRNQVFQTLDSKFLRRNKADRSASHRVRPFIFQRAPGGRFRKIVAKFPGGGAMTSKRAA